MSAPQNKVPVVKPTPSQSTEETASPPPPPPPAVIEPQPEPVSPAEPAPESPTPAPTPAPAPAPVPVVTKPKVKKPKVKKPKVKKPEAAASTKDSGKYMQYRYRTRILKGSILPILYGFVSFQMLNLYFIHLRLPRQHHSSFPEVPCPENPTKNGTEWLSPRPGSWLLWPYFLRFPVKRTERQADSIYVKGHGKVVETYALSTPVEDE